MQAFPDRVFIFSSDEDVKRQMLALGIPSEHLKGSALQGSATNAFLVWVHHATHWLLFCRFGAHGEKTDNYLLVGWPKRQFTRDAFVQEADEFLQGVSPGAKIRTADIDPAAS